MVTKSPVSHHQLRSDVIIALQSRLAGDLKDPTTAAAKHARIHVIASFYFHMIDSGRSREAFAVVDEAVSLAASLPSTFADRASDLALCHDLLARRQLFRRNYNEALEEEKQAIALRRTLPTSDPASRIQVEAGLATSLNGARRAAGQLAKWSIAADYNLEAVQLLQQHRANGHDVDLKGLTYNLVHLSEAYLHIERIDEALRAAEESAKIARDDLPDDPAILARALLSHAVVLGELGRADEAVTDMNEAIATLSGAPEPRGFDVALAHVNRAKHLRSLGRQAEVKEDLERAIEIYRAWYGEPGGAGLTQAEELLASLS